MISKSKTRTNAVGKNGDIREGTYFVKTPEEMVSALKYTILDRITIFLDSKKHVYERDSENRLVEIPDPNADQNALLRG